MKTHKNKPVAALAVCLMLLSLPVTIYAWEPSAKELDASLNSGDFAGYFANISAWLDQKTPADPGKITEAAMTDLIKDPVFRNALDQRQFMAAHGVANISAFARVEAHRTFLAWVMKSTQLMDLYLEAVVSTAGQINDGAIGIAALERWHKLYTEDPDSREGIYLKLAMATALWPPGGRCTYRDEVIDWMLRYKHFKTAHQNKELVASFDHLLVCDYGKVVNSTAADKDLAWGRQMIRSWRPDLLEKEQIHKIVSEVWRRASPIPFDNGYVTVLEGGGKCGPRGAFGAFILQACGIPAITVGQPAHFCFAGRADFPEEEPQPGSVWKVYQGRGWHVSDCGGNMWGPQYLAEMTKRYRTAELSTIAHLSWLASALSSKQRADAARDLAVKVRKPVNTSNPLGVPASEVDVILAGKASKAAASAAASKPAREVETDINTEGPSPTTAASNAASTPARVKEEPFTVAPGVIHVEAETFSAKSPEVTVYDCYTGGKQVNFHKSIESSWLDYVIDAPEAGTYALEIMLAAANRDLVLNVSCGAEKLGAISIPGTTGLWKKMAPVAITLNKGSQTLRISAPFQRGIAVRWFELAPTK